MFPSPSFSLLLLSLSSNCLKGLHLFIKTEDKLTTVAFSVGIGRGAHGVRRGTHSNSSPQTPRPWPLEDLKDLGLSTFLEAPEMRVCVYVCVC